MIHTVQMSCYMPITLSLISHILPNLTIHLLEHLLSIRWPWWSTPDTYSTDLTLIVKKSSPGPLRLMTWQWCLCRRGVRMRWEVCCRRINVFYVCLYISSKWYMVSRGICLSIHEAYVTIVFTNVPLSLICRHDAPGQPGHHNPPQYPR